MNFIKYMLKLSYSQMKFFPALKTYILIGKNSPHKIQYKKYSKKYLGSPVITVNGSAAIFLQPM